MAGSTAKRTKKSASRRRKNTDSVKVEGLKPFKENMSADSEVSVRSRRRKAPKIEVAPPRNPLDNFESLEIERPMRRHRPVLLDPTLNWRAWMMEVFLQYGLWLLTVLTLCGGFAFYLYVKHRPLPIKLSGDGVRTVFQIGIAEEYCRIRVASRPVSASIEVNGVALIQRTPVNLLLPCNRTFMLTLREKGFIPVGTFIKSKDETRLLLSLDLGQPTFTDELRVKYLSAVRPILQALNF